MDGSGENEKKKKSFEIKRKRYKLCREEIDVEISLCETAAVNKGFVRRYSSTYVLTHGHTIVTITRG